jgi:hypothetical protein
MISLGIFTDITRVVFGIVSANAAVFDSVFEKPNLFRQDLGVGKIGIEKIIGHAGGAFSSNAGEFGKVGDKGIQGIHNQTRLSGNPGGRFNPPAI